MKAHTARFVATVACSLSIVLTTYAAQVISLPTPGNGPTDEDIPPGPYGFHSSADGGFSASYDFWYEVTPEPGEDINSFKVFTGVQYDGFYYVGLGLTYAPAGWSFQTYQTASGYVVSWTNNFGAPLPQGTNTTFGFDAGEDGILGDWETDTDVSSAHSNELDGLGYRVHVPGPDRLGIPDMYLSHSGSQTFPYDSWVKAATNLDVVLEAAGDGTTIHVTNGTYELLGFSYLRHGTTLRSVNGPEQTTFDAMNQYRSVLMSHPDAAIEGFTFKNAWGSIVSIYQNGGIIDRCIFTGNKGYQGGAVSLVTNGIVRNSLFHHNDGSFGGAIYSHGAGVIDNCTIVDNTAAFGGGIFGANDLTVRNCIVVDNFAFAGENIFGAGPTMTLEANCTFPLIPGGMNIAVDPLFVDSPTGDYRLQLGSPCQDGTGSLQPWMSGADDLAGNPRLNNGVVDQGAYEYVNGPLEVNIVAFPGEGFAPLEVVFVAHAASTTSSSFVYNWDLNGDAIPEYEGPSARVITNLYGIAGAYAVSLVVSNSAGETASINISDLVRVGVETAFVWKAGSHQFPYSTLSSAATSITEAMKVAVDGSTILIQNGTYTQDQAIVLDRGITLAGRRLDQPTIIDGRNINRCFYMDHPDAKLENLTLQRGYAGDGGAVYMARGGTVENCLIRNSFAVSNGHAAYMNLGGVIRSTVVTDNGPDIDSAGTAVYCGFVGQLLNSSVSNNNANGVQLYGVASMDGCSVRGNGLTGIRSFGGFGAVLFTNTYISRTLIADNGSTGVSGYGTILDTCLIRNNQDGGVYSYWKMDILNCTIVENEGVGLDARDDTVINTIIYSNRSYSPGSPDVQWYWYNGTPHFEACCTPLSSLPGTNNITGYPQFVLPQIGDYRLLSSSPCIDSGVANGSSLPDLDGRPRPLDGDDSMTAEFDIGAYEFASSTLDSDGDGLTDLLETTVTGTDPHRVDSDDDGMGDGQEYVAGSNGSDPDSIFVSRDAMWSNVGDGRFEFYWDSAVDRLYTVIRAPSMDGPWTAIPGQIDRPGTGYMMVYQAQIAATNAGPLYYNVKVKLAP